MKSFVRKLFSGRVAPKPSTSRALPVHDGLTQTSPTRQTKAATHFRHTEITRAHIVNMAQREIFRRARTQISFHTSLGKYKFIIIDAEGKYMFSNTNKIAASDITIIATADILSRID